MSYFKDVFEGNGGGWDGHSCSVIQMSHPALYVFLDQYSRVYEAIKLMKSFYAQKLKDTSGIAYLCFSDAAVFSKELDGRVYYVTPNLSSRYVLDALQEIQSSFLRREYERPIDRRCYIICNISEPQLVPVTKVVNFLKDFFQSVNNIPVIDIYAIIDEERPYSENVGKVLGELQSINDKCNMIYLLSNFTSNNKLTDDFTQHYRAIALCSILKGCFAEQSQGLAAYDERAFIQNSQINGPGFYTIGAKKMDKPIDLIKAVAVKEILDKDSHRYHSDIDSILKDFDAKKEAAFEGLDMLYQHCIERQRKHIFSLAAGKLQAMAMLLTRGEMLDAVFGAEIIDSFYRLNLEKDMLDNEANLFKEFLESYIEGCLENPQIGFFAAAELLKRMKETTLPEKRQRLSNELEENNKHLNHWLNSPVKHGTGKTRGIFNKIPELPFLLAQEYIYIKNQCGKSAKALELLEIWIQTIDKYMDEINRVCSEIERETNYLDSYITSGLSSKPLIIAENFEKHYKKRISEYIGRDLGFFNTIYSEFYNMGPKEIFEKSISYVIKMIESGEFSESVYEEIHDRVTKNDNTQFDTDEKITGQLYKELVNERVYFCNLLFKGELFEESCCITGDKALISRFRDKSINLFYDGTDKELELLYIMGAFSPDSLFYARQYGF